MFRFGISVLILCLALSAACFASDRYVFGYGMIEDAYLNGGTGNEDKNYGGSLTLYCDASARQGLLRIKDITDSLPPNTTVENCSLYVWVTEGCESDSAALAAYRLFKTAWIEGSENGADPGAGGTNQGCTWHDWNSDEKEWGTAGAENANDGGSDNDGDGTGYDRKTTAEGADTCEGVGDVWFAISISAAFVQARYDNGAGDDDVNLFLQRTQNYPKITSSEGTEANRPYLVVNYTTQEADSLLWPFLKD